MKLMFEKPTEGQFEIDMSTQVTEYWSEVRRLLPNLPDNITIDVYRLEYAAGMGTVRGASIRPDLIELGIMEQVPVADIAKDIKNLVFHEAYHQAHGYTFAAFDEGPAPSALEIAAYEGAANVFAAKYAESANPSDQYDDEFINTWLPLVTELSVDDYYEDHKKWRFHDPDTDTGYILYRLGTWMVRRAIERSGKSIIDLLDLSGQEIIELAELDDSTDASEKA